MESLWTDVFEVGYAQRWVDANGVRTRVLEAGELDQIVGGPGLLDDPAEAPDGGHRVAGEAAQAEWKKAVLAGEIVLEDIDTEPFNITRGRKPTQVSTKKTSSPSEPRIAGVPV